jgi:chromosome segregation ATPase
VPIDIESLKQERDQVKDSLRQIEADTRRLDLEVKTLRQREIQAKREIDALTALIEIADSRNTPVASE